MNIMLFSCTTTPYFLEESLTLAGTNRPELERVLAHYRSNSADSLKYHAAVFLISNMAAHYSYAGEGLSNYYDAMDSVARLFGDKSEEEAMNAIKSLETNLLEANFFENTRLISDVETIEADYLIDNIDRAFELWQNSVWLSFLNFDNFCELLLPYKVCETQTLDNWRQYFSDARFYDLSNLHYTSQSTLRACEKVNAALTAQLPKLAIQTSLPPVRRMNSLLSSLKQRDCEDDTYLEASVLRAKGIPVAIDFTPQWTWSRKGHQWCVVPDNTGKHYAFGAFSHSVTMSINGLMSKVYRQTYALNRELVVLKQSGETIPPLFLNNLCLKDVTEEYQNTTDVAVQIEKCNNKYAYLCTFDDRMWWNPIAFGKIKGKKAHFEKMGRNIVYLPMAFGNDDLQPLSPPFLLTYQGFVKFIVPDLSKKQTLTLYRKHPPHWSLDVIVGEKIYGSKFQAANRPDFSDAETIHVIDKFGTESDEIVVGTKRKFRYWRHLFLPGSYGGLSEVYYFCNGENISKKGKVIGTRGETDIQQPENLYDNDPLTCFEAPEISGGWSGLDFGEPVAIELILYAPRADGNCVTYGDEYELSFWDKNKWNSLGKKTANNIYISFENCPAGALFLLNDCTRGIQNRVFTYENGKQIWW
jgi:hypothetical protein